MPNAGPTHSRRDIEDLIGHWLSEHIRRVVHTIGPDQILAIDFGAAGDDADLLLATIHAKFGTDFSELDADAGFGTDEWTPVAGNAGLPSLCELIVPKALRVFGDGGPPPGMAFDPWVDAMVRVSDLVEAIEHGAWAHRDRPRTVPEARLDPLSERPGTPPFADITAANLRAVHHYLRTLRAQIRHPGVPLPEHAWRNPVNGFRRLQPIRCPWCDRRELVSLDPSRFGDWSYTCLACGGDSTLLNWSHAITKATNRLRVDAAFALLLALGAAAWLCSLPGTFILCMLAALVYAFFLMTGRGQTRRLPGGAPPRPPEHP